MPTIRTERENTTPILLTELPNNVDVVFIGAFTEAAHTAYALSNLFRGRGAITAIGGPHARCYAEDAARYFDYVLGFTDKGTLQDRVARPLATPAHGRPPRGLPAAQNPPGGSPSPISTTMAAPTVRQLMPFNLATTN